MPAPDPFPAPPPPHPFLAYWEKHYAARHAAEVAAETQRRTEAFIDLPRRVGPFWVRPPTALDLLVLEGIESPLLAEAVELVTSIDLELALWQLRPEAGGWWARRRHALRCTTRYLAPGGEKRLCADLFDLVSLMREATADAGGKRTGAPTRKPLGTAWLAPLVVNLAAETGWSEAEILRLPLARAWQYLRCLRARHAGKDYTDFSPSDRLKSEALAAFNREQAAAAAPPPAPAPPDLN
jgi:hypothetical protein